MANTRRKNRIAVICLGHSGNPAGMVRLARYFAGTPSDVYMHVDGKAEIARYRDACGMFDNLTLIEDRIEVYWGGFNLVRAIVHAMRMAYNAHPYERFCLISEDSVPLVTPALFTQLMGAPCEYMQALRATAEVLPRYDNFYYFDSAATNERTVPGDRIVAPSMLGDLERLEALRETGKLEVKRLFHGPGWWAVSARAAHEILVQFDHSHHLRESFEFSMIPDEQYFHTILANAARRFEFRPFIYADFTREPRPYIYRTLRELESLRGQPLVFARKAALDSPEVERYFELLRGAL